MLYLFAFGPFVAALALARKHRVAGTAIAAVVAIAYTVFGFCSMEGSRVVIFKAKPETDFKEYYIDDTRFYIFVAAWIAFPVGIYRHATKLERIRNSLQKLNALKSKHRQLIAQGNLSEAALVAEQINVCAEEHNQHLADMRAVADINRVSADPEAGVQNEQRGIPTGPHVEIFCMRCKGRNTYFLSSRLKVIQCVHCKKATNVPPQHLV